MNFVKFILLLVAISLLLFSGYIAMAFFGNPFVLISVNDAAEAYIDEKYPDRELVVEDAFFNFKLTDYVVNVHDPALVDCYFSLYFDENGKLTSDTYSDSYLSGFNTGARIDNAYRSLTDTVFKSEAFDFNASIAYGIIEFTDKADGDPDREYSIPYSSLTLNGDFTTKEYGERAGALVIYIVTEDVSAEAMANTLLAIREVFDEANVPFKVIDLTLTVEEYRANEGTSILAFAYEDIYEEGLLERVNTAIDETEQFYDRLDAEKEAELAGE